MFPIILCSRLQRFFRTYSINFCIFSYNKGIPICLSLLPFSVPMRKSFIIILLFNHQRITFRVSLINHTWIDPSKESSMVERGFVSTVINNFLVSLMLGISSPVSLSAGNSISTKTTYFGPTSPFWWIFHRQYRPFQVLE